MGQAWGKLPKELSVLPSPPELSFLIAPSSLTALSSGPSYPRCKDALLLADDCIKLSTVWRDGAIK